MLIIEGTDLVGKTTVCQSLFTKLRTHVYSHFTRLPSEFSIPSGYAHRISRFVIQDRFHMSEVAYALARGETPRISPQEYRVVDALVRLVGGYTVVITVDEDLIKERWGRDEMYSQATVIKANKEFSRVITSRIPQYPRMDWDLHIMCTPVYPFVDAEMIDKICYEYEKRQLEFINTFAELQRNANSLISLI